MPNILYLIDYNTLDTSTAVCICDTADFPVGKQLTLAL